MDGLAINILEALNDWRAKHHRAFDGVVIISIVDAEAWSGPSYVDEKNFIWGVPLYGRESDFRHLHVVRREAMKIAKHRGNVKICRNCGAAIMEFEFTEGKQWWHFGATPHLYCIGNSGMVAEP